MFSSFSSSAKGQQRKQLHSLKLGQKRRESSKRNYYISSPRVVIKAIIINKQTGSQKLSFNWFTEWNVLRNKEKAYLNRE